MLRIKPALEGVILVFRGSFNPAIIQPGWLSKYDLIGEKEAMSARVEIIAPELTVLALDHFTIQMQPDSLTLANHDVHFDLIRDFAIALFAKLLPHTPITLMGINRLVHFDCGSFEARETIGEMLAPKRPWGEWAPALVGETGPTAEHGGMTSLTMKQLKRPDGRKGSIQAQIEPSSKIGPAGIYMAVNDHYEFGSDQRDTSGAVQVLETCWAASLEYSELIINQIMALVPSRVN